MRAHEIIIEGDVAGTRHVLPYLTFEGREKSTPKTYIQAGLHAGELPGVAALHLFIPMLEAAEARGDLMGDVTIVPKANPIGAAQWLHGELQGRFDIASRSNFNRDFPLVPLAGREGLTGDIRGLSAVDQLKRHLLALALEADFVLDLHCDDESVLYSYLHADFWPAATDLAESFGLDAVLLSDGESSAFEDAVSHAWRNSDAGSGKSWADGRISLTMEFRGTRDVSPSLAERDARSIHAFLQRRGVIAGEPLVNTPFRGPVAGLDYVQMVDAPVSGTVLFERDHGESVQAGDLLATVIPSPGNPSADFRVTAPVDGYIVTRVSARFVRRGDNLMKIASHALSGKARKPGGGLED